ncbi:helix-turn-helix domain-containing protein [Brevibacillus brevis]|uniref:helix-turn-helix domain-containing protein n=1 Tax=Brevibacillus brevis TaxID=1393 RepID=UPI0007D8B8F8|nr:helix-turn-helix transcriptional regulator [Brevibacillus brevis]
MIKIHLKETLREKRLTQKKLSELSNVNIKYISNLCTQKVKRLDLEKLGKICAILDCQPGEILEFIPEENTLSPFESIQSFFNKTAIDELPESEGLSKLIQLMIGEMNDQRVEIFFSQQYKSSPVAMKITETAKKQFEKCNQSVKAEITKEIDKILSLRSRNLNKRLEADGNLFRLDVTVKSVFLFTNWNDSVIYILHILDPFKIVSILIRNEIKKRLNDIFN